MFYDEDKNSVIMSAYLIREVHFGLHLAYHIATIWLLKWMSADVDCSHKKTIVEVENGSE